MRRRDLIQYTALFLLSVAVGYFITGSDEPLLTCGPEVTDNWQKITVVNDKEWVIDGVRCRRD